MCSNVPEEMEFSSQDSRTESSSFPRALGGLVFTAVESGSAVPALVRGSSWLYFPLTLTIDLDGCYKVSED